ncbi:MAG: hypothetical protein Q9M92_17015 [Enterobacterales bacterium]|nr:hypothetical protein [Enterobacterales bacterium]
MFLKQGLENEFLSSFGHRKRKNAERLLSQLFHSPKININQVAELLGVRKNTASALVADFVNQAVLQEVTGQQRNRIFYFRDYIQIFKD